MDSDTELSDRAFTIELYRRFDEVIWAMARRSKHLKAIEKAARRDEKRHRSAEAARARNLLRRVPSVFNEPSFASVYPVSLAPADVVRAAVRITSYLWVARSVTDSSKLSGIAHRLKRMPPVVRPPSKARPIPPRRDREIFRKMRLVVF